MENFNGTAILAIIDKSGSMGSIKSDAIGGFNNFLSDQQNQEGECIISTVLFDTGYDLINHGINIKDMQPLNNSTYVPCGGTALYDAIGRGVSDVEKMQIKADRYLCVILTDGEENCNREFNKAKINELISEKRKGDWEFIFLAANQDALQEGASLGMLTSSSCNFTATGDGVNLAYADMSRGVTSYRKMSKATLSSSKFNLLSEEE